MNRYISILSILIVFWVIGCKPKMTCSAYQSYYILDNEYREELFSPFGKDSLPKNVVTKKDGDGIAQKVDDKIFEKKHYFIPMKLIPPKPLEDSASADSVQADSLGNIGTIDDIEPTNNINPDVKGPENPGKEEGEETIDDIDLEDEDLWDEEDEDDEGDDNDGGGGE